MIGYDKLPYNSGLLLDLTFEEMTGLVVYDRAKPHHPNVTLQGTPTWITLASGLPALSFDRTNPDWLECPAADTVDLDFITGDFSAACWLYTLDLSWTSFPFCRGDENVDGWFMSRVGSRIAIATNQGGNNQRSWSPEGVITENAWFLLGWSRAGAVGKTIINGREVTTVSNAHINPTTSARRLHIGIRDDETAMEHNGYMARPRIWGAELTDEDWRVMFETERHWFGV